MTIFIFLLLSSDWSITKTDIFLPFVRHQVVATQEGNFFLLDRQGKFLKMYDKDGVHVDTFAGQGKGPGQLRAPLFIYVYGNQVFVPDAYSVKVYDKMGFVMDYKKLLFSRIVPVSNGFIWHESDSQKMAGEKNSLFFAENFDIEQSKALVTWQLPSDHEDRIIPKLEKGKKLRLKPRPTKFITAKAGLAKDGSRIFFLGVDHSHVHIIDGNGGRILGTIDLTDYNVKSLLVDAFDTLWVSTEKNGYLYFDKDGKPAPPSPFSRKNIDDIHLVRDGWAYISTFLKGVEEAEIYRCRLDEIKAFFTAHPTSLE